MGNDLEKKMGIERLPTIKKDMPDAIDDFMHAREKIIETIEGLDEEIERLKALAQQTEHARYYEALQTYYKLMIEANDKLLDIQKKIRQIQADDEHGPKSAIAKQQNIFVGSSSELLDLIKGKKIIDQS